MDKQTIIALLQDQAAQIQAKKNNRAHPTGNPHHPRRLTIASIAFISLLTTSNSTYHGETPANPLSATSMGKASPVTYAPYQLIEPAPCARNELIQSIGNTTLCQPI